MKVFVPDELESSRYFAREAVRVGSKDGGQFDWEIATDKLKIALGYAEIKVVDVTALGASVDSINTYGNNWVLE